MNVSRDSPEVRASALKAEVLKALASAARIRIIELLRERPRCACEIPGILGLEQPNVSQHLAVLRRSGLVNAARDGSRIIYSVDRDEVFAILDLVDALVRGRHRDMGALLAQLEPPKEASSLAGEGG